MKHNPRPQDIAFVTVAAFAVAACLYFPVPTWMLVFSLTMLVLVIVGMIGNMGFFQKRQRR